MNTSSSESSQQSRVWELQEPFLAQQYGAGQELAQQQMGPVAAEARRLSGMFLPQLAAGARSTADIATGADPTTQFLQSRLGADNPYLQATIDAFGDDISRQEARSLAMSSGRAAYAGGAGAVGGARDQIERGMIHEAAQREFSQGAQDIRFADYGRQGAEAESLANLRLRGGGLLPAQGQAAVNMGLTPYTAAWMPLQQQAMLLGRPTLLSSGSSESSSFGFSL